MDLRYFRFYGAEMITAKILPICVEKNALRAKFGSSRKVRDRDGEKPNKSEEEMIVSIPISKSFGDFNLVVKALKLSG